MGYTNPGFNNDAPAYLNATNMNYLANAVQSAASTLECVPITNGGTGAESVEAARSNLGLSLPLGLSKGGTGQTSRNGILAMLGLETQGRVFQVFSGSQYCAIKGMTSTTSYSIDSIDIPCCLYVGATDSADKMTLLNLPPNVSSANLYVITFFSPTNTTTVTTRRLQLVIPEVDNKAVYMRIVHGSTSTGWGKINFTSL